MEPHKAVAVSDPSQIGAARRTATSIAAALGLGPADTGKLAIIATEVASNIIKHAKTGQMLISPLASRGAAGVEILGLDKGPGMGDVARCVQDGCSTAGSPGTGLGAIARLSSLCDIYSAVGSGTVVLSRLWDSAPPAAEHAAPLEFGGISVAFPGETACGDAWAIGHAPDRSMMMVVDGLGHGPLAAVAAQEAVRIFRENADQGPDTVLGMAHRALLGTRGAAAAILEASAVTREVRYAGLGNISGAIVTHGSAKSMLSQSGTIGLVIRRIQVFPYHWSQGAIILMYSDGISTRWSFDSYPGLLHKHPSVIAAVLYRDFSRGRDDVTIAVAREMGKKQ